MVGISSELCAEGSHYFTDFVGRLLDEVDDCVRRAADRFERDHVMGPRLPDMLRECITGARGQVGDKPMYFFVFDPKGHDQPWKHPNSIVLMPDCKDASIVEALSVAARCKEAGNPLVAIVFATKTWKPKMRDVLRDAWISAKSEGVRLITEYVIRWSWAGM